MNLFLNSAFKAIPMAVILSTMPFDYCAAYSTTADKQIENHTAHFKAYSGYNITTSYINDNKEFNMELSVLITRLEKLLGIAIEDY